MQFSLATVATLVALANAEPRFKRFFQIIMENTNFEVAMNQTFMPALAAQGRLFTNMHGITHPSQPNYVAMIAGDTLGVINDHDVNITASCIADTLEAAGKTWVSYQEQYPGSAGNCFTGTEMVNGDLHLYERKHNPFMSFTSIQNTARCDNIKNANELDKDIAAGKVADYVLYAPDQVNDGHGANYSRAFDYKSPENQAHRIAVADQWLSTFIPKYINNPFFKDTLFLLTFDESNVDVVPDPSNINHIYTIAIGAGVEKGSKDDTRYDHYAQLALLNKEWGLKPLGRNDTYAVAFDLGNPSKPSTPSTPAPCTTTEAPKTKGYGTDAPKPTGYNAATTTAYGSKPIYSSAMASSFSVLAVAALVLAL
ncbi:hypothetical protein HDV04_001576 [Boothiomyces sp. JEL0838]|nr:hypothetical protein HDV04_001576 [Boothiomyces sp. JEL0838]